MRVPSWKWQMPLGIILAIAIFLLPTPHAIAQTNLTPITYLDNAPQIDGLGDDWQFSGMITYKQPNPNPDVANQLRITLGWDEQYLYLYAEVDDHNIVQLTHDVASIYLNDAVELFIDPLDDSRNRMDINDYQFIVDHTGAVAVLKGDKSLIMDSSKTVPKELGIATVAFQHAVERKPNGKGGDMGYAVELAVPFAAIGVEPRAGTRLKIDFCVDDADTLVNLDSLPPNAHLPGYFASNWDGESDFSFPDRWRSFVLEGGPSVTTQISRDLLPYWIWIVLALVIVAAGAIGWQAYRIAQLKDVLPRKALKPELVAGLSASVNHDNQPPAKEDLAEQEILNESHLQPNADLAPTSHSHPLERALNLHPQIEKCRQFVLAHLDQDLKMEDLASECALSLRSLQRLFKDELDMSPVNFVVLIKMERAAELLRSGTCNVSEAAWQLGFQDSSYFSRVFKKYHGIPPSKIA